MTDESLYRALTEGTRRDGRVFLDIPGGEAVTFTEFHQRCDALAGALFEHGARAGRPMLVQLPKSIDAFAIYLAALRIGAIYVPLNPAYTTAELTHFVADAEPTLYVGELRGESPSAGLEEIRLTANRVATPPDTSASGATTATMLYTSGTTGPPKGAPASAAGLLANARDLTERWRFSEDDVLLHVLPIFHVHGLFVALHCALLSGCRVVFHERFDADAVASALGSATVLMAVPTMYSRLLGIETLDRASTAGMRLFTSGSAPLAATTHDEFTERTGHRIVERYGLTETGILTSNHPGAETPGSVGSPLPSVEVRVIDETGELARPGLPGEVQARGVQVLDGYWRVPTADTAAFTPDGWFRTGDIGAWGADGLLRLLGRVKDVVISGGLNVYPAEVEASILSSGAVAEVAVIGLPHPDLGEAVVAVTPGPIDPATVDLGDIAPFKRPKAWIVAGELPRNAMGKVEKHSLRRRFADHFD